MRLPSSTIAFLVLMLLVSNASAQDVWFGTSTSAKGESKGIYHARFDPETGKLSQATLAAEIASPGFLALHPEKPLLYSVGRAEGEPSVAAFSIEKDGKLTLINTQPIGDGGAAHLAVHPAGKMLISAQYGGGSTAVFPLDEEGKIGARSQLLKHEGGTGIVKGRQDKPHAHWTGFDKAGNFAFVPDLGMDGAVIYKVTKDGTALENHGFGKSEAGGGARHMKFSPDEKLAFILNELTLSVTSFSYDAKAGTLTPITTVPALSEEVKAQETFNSASEICVHPNGKFIYSANRGHDTITVYNHDGKGGLTVVEVEPIRGSWPRNFNLDPSGRWLLAAGQNSSTVAVFAIDQETGKLSFPRGAVINVPTPICVLFGR